MNAENPAPVKHNRASRKLMSKILNFLCALIITFVVIFAIGAFISADSYSKDMIGNHDSQIFSFNRTQDNKAEVMAFGEKFILDFEKIYNAQKKLNSLSSLNREYTPAIFTLSGDIIVGCISSVIESFKKIPAIAEYFYNKIVTEQDY